MDETAAEQPTEFWYNLKTKEVEIGKQSAAVFRVGPFATFEEAAKAIEILKNRARKWQDEENQNG